MSGRRWIKRPKLRWRQTQNLLEGDRLGLGYASEYGLEVLLLRVSCCIRFTMSERMGVHLPAGCDVRDSRLNCCESLGRRWERNKGEREGEIERKNCKLEQAKTTNGSLLLYSEPRLGPLVAARSTPADRGNNSATLLNRATTPQHTRPSANGHAFLTAVYPSYTTTGS